MASKNSCIDRLPPVFFLCSRGPTFSYRGGDPTPPLLLAGRCGAQRPRLRGWGWGPNRIERRLAILARAAGATSSRSLAYPEFMKISFSLIASAVFLSALSGRAQDIPQLPVRVGGNIPIPTKIRDVKPVYPADAQGSGVQGIVIIEATIDPAGKVFDARVVRSIPLLDKAAIDAVRQW